MGVTQLTFLTSEGAYHRPPCSAYLEPFAPGVEVQRLKQSRRHLRFFSAIPWSNAFSSIFSEASLVYSLEIMRLANTRIGIMRCDYIAEGVVKATKELSLNIPLVVRLKGNKEPEAKQ